MSQAKTLLMGAVAYDPKVVIIWDGFRQYFAGQGLDFDYELYSNYERQVESHLAGHIHVAWNSPLAWLQTKAVAERLGRRAQAICMRDTDRDLTSVIIVKEDSAIRQLADLNGKRVGVGASDSPQAYLIPLGYLAEAGLHAGKQVDVVPFDVLLGKHGDHIGGEREAVQALLRGEVDAACLIDANYLWASLRGNSASWLCSGAGADPPLRSLQLHGFRGCSREADPALSGATSGYDVFGPESAAAVGPRRAEAVASWTYGWLSPARVSS
jgi:ABC-type phosphate/phosphonate transport system substrate-binding protein